MVCCFVFTFPTVADCRLRQLALHDTHHKHSGDHSRQEPQRPHCAGCVHYHRGAHTRAHQHPQHHRH